MDDIRTWSASHGLVRSSGDRVVGGVCAGLGRRVGLDPWPARLLFVLLLLLVPGSQVIVYPVLWVLLPLDTSTGTAGTTAPAAGTWGQAPTSY